MGELMLDKNYKKGDKGKEVKKIQEWLCYHGYGLYINSYFGPATDYAVRLFQRIEGLEEDGIVGANTFSALTLPMVTVLRPIPIDGKSLGEMVVAYAKQHLKQHPREIGGQNMGPWVRLYMNGKEGELYLWCAGFVSFILKQACDTLNVPLPIETSVSCDNLAKSAKENNKLLEEPKIEERKRITPGSLFLQFKRQNEPPKDWNHTGIVIRAKDEVFLTIEGNTNDEGKNQGYEVCSRIKGYKNKDFILI